MKKLIFIVLLISAFQLKAQDTGKKFDVRFGIGTSLLGSGDMVTLAFENEVNYNINRYFAASVSLGYGRSNHGVYESSSYIQGNLNVFVSPFRNNSKNDFRIGAGFSMMNIFETYGEQEYCGVGYPDNIQPQFDRRNSFGYNIIIEDTYTFSNMFLIGLKVFTQPFTNEDINSGIMLKTGILF